MRADSLAVALLLVGVAFAGLGSLVTLATTTLVTPAAVGTLVVLVLAVLVASAIGTWADKRPNTPYW